jgi:tetratricopeptide (TPR) repeat protein
LADDLEALLREAETRFTQRDWDGAIEAYKKVMQADPQNEEACETLARSYCIRGLITDAIAQYFTLMQILEQKGELDLAIDVSRWIQKIQPENDKARMALILIFRKKGDNEEVVRQSLQLARLYIELGQGDRSIELLKSAQEIEPDNLDIGMELAEMYISHGHIQEGADQFRKIANSFLDTGNYEKAADAYKRMKLFQADDPGLLFTLGNIYASLGRLNDAEAEFRSILRHDLNHQDALMALGNVCQQKGQFRDAILAFNKILSITPEQVVAKEKLGELYQAQGNVSESIKHYLAAASQLQAENNTPRAVRLFQRIVSLDPTNPTATRELDNLGAERQPAVEEEMTPAYQPPIGPPRQQAAQPPVVAESGDEEEAPRPQPVAAAPPAPPPPPQPPAPEPEPAVMAEAPPAPAQPVAYIEDDEPPVQNDFVPSSAPPAAPSPSLASPAPPRTPSTTGGGLVPRGDGSAGGGGKTLLPRSGGTAKGGLIPKGEGGGGGGASPLKPRIGGGGGEGRQTLSKLRAPEAGSSKPQLIRSRASEETAQAVAVSEPEPEVAPVNGSVENQAAQGWTGVEDAPPAWPSATAEEPVARAAEPEAPAAWPSQEAAAWPPQPAQQEAPAAPPSWPPQPAQQEAPAPPPAWPPQPAQQEAPAPPPAWPPQPAQQEAPPPPPAWPPQPAQQEAPAPPTAWPPQPAQQEAPPPPPAWPPQPAQQEAPAPPSAWPPQPAQQEAPPPPPAWPPQPAQQEAPPPPPAWPPQPAQQEAPAPPPAWPAQPAQDAPQPEEAAPEPPVVEALPTVEPQALAEPETPATPPSWFSTPDAEPVPASPAEAEFIDSAPPEPAPPPPRPELAAPQPAPEPAVAVHEPSEEAAATSSESHAPKLLSKRGGEGGALQKKSLGRPSMLSRSSKPTLPTHGSTEEPAAASEAAVVTEPAAEAPPVPQVSEAPAPASVPAAPAPAPVAESADDDEGPPIVEHDEAARPAPEPVVVAPQPVVVAPQPVVVSPQLVTAEGPGAAEALQAFLSSSAPRLAQGSEAGSAERFAAHMATVLATETHPSQPVVPVEAAADPSFEAAKLEEYIGTGDLNRALLAFRKRLQENPNDTTMRARLAEILFNYGIVEEAASEYLAIARVDNTNLPVLQRLVEAYLWSEQPDRAVPVLVGLSYVHRQRGEIDEAFQVLQDALTIQRENPEARWELAELFNQAGQVELANWHLRLMADIADEQQNAEAATETYRKLYQMTGSTTDQERLAEMFEKYGRAAEAVTEYKQLALRWHQAGQAGKARDIYERIARLAPQDMEAQEALLALYQAGGESDKLVDRMLIVARVAWDNNDLERALRLYDEIVKRDPSQVDAKRALVELYLQRGQWAEARAESQALLEAWYRDNRPTEAIDLLSRFIQMQPEDLTAHDQLIHFYERAEEIDKALAARLNLAQILLARGQTEEALKNLQKAMSLDERNANVHYQLGLFYADRLGDAASAEKSFLRVKALEPTHKEAMKRLVYLQLQLGKPAEAIETLSDLIKLAPENAAIRDEIVAEYRRRTAEQPDDVQAKFTLGILYKEQGNLEPAIEMFQETRKYPQLTLQSYNMLGTCFALKKGYNTEELAIKQFRKGIETKTYPGGTYPEEDYQELRYNLAELYNRRNEIQEALSLYQEIYSIDINYRDVAEKMKQLREEMDGGGKITRMPPRKGLGNG